MSVWTSTWGSEKSQVPPASHANPASQEAISSARAGRRTRLTVCRSMDGSHYMGLNDSRPSGKRSPTGIEVVYSHKKINGIECRK